MNKHRIIGLLVIIALIVITTEFLLNYRKPEVATPSILPPAAIIQEQAIVTEDPVTEQPVVEQPLPVAEPLVDNAAEDKKLIATRNEQAWVVQVASYSDQPRADKLVATLQAKAFDAFSYSIVTNSKTYVRVSVGPVATKQDAEVLKAQLLEKAKLAGFVNPYTPDDEASQ